MNEISLTAAATIATVIATISFVVSGVHAYRTKGNQGTDTAMLGIHTLAWQASAGLNILFWVSVSTNPIMTICLAMISLCMDLGKILIPRAKRATLAMRATAVLFTVMSIFASTNMGKEIVNQSSIDSARNELTLERATVDKELAQERVSSNYVPPHVQQNIAALNVDLRNLENRYAVNSLNQIAYKGGKKLDVKTATNYCQTGNAFTKIAANQCKRIQSLRIEVSTLQTNASTHLDNKANLSKTLKANQEALEGIDASVDIGDSIKKVLLMIGVSNANIEENKLVSVVFGLILALCLDAVIFGTLPRRKKKPLYITRMIKIYLSKKAKNGDLGRDKSGTKVGHLLDKSVQQVSSAEFATKTPLIDTLSDITLDTLEEHINLTLGRGLSNVKPTTREALVFILSRKNSAGESTIGEDLSINNLFKASRKAFGHGNGIRKEAFTDAKEILYYNGIMTAKPYGKDRTQYIWMDADLMEVKYQAVKNGKVIQKFINTLREDEAEHTSNDNVFQLPLVAVN